MADIQEKIKDNYIKNLKPSEYLEEISYYWNALPKTFRFMMKSIYDVFQSGRFKGSKLLEIGSGATVHSIASASAYFPNIVLSDYVEANTEELKSWLRGESNLRQLLDISAGLEGYGNDLDDGRRTLESRIRKCVKRVTRCDLLTEGILLDKADSPDTSPPFDVVITCLCLEVAPKDFTGYVDSLKRINSIICPGGGLIACGFLQGGYWNIGEKSFHHIQLGEKDVVDALVQAGFGNISLKTIRKEKGEDFPYKYDKFYCISAEKL